MLRKRIMDSSYLINKQLIRPSFSNIPKDERSVLTKCPRRNVELGEYRERIDKIKDISNKSFARVPQETWDLLDKMENFFKKQKLIIDKLVKNEADSENSFKMKNR